MVAELYYSDMETVNTEPSVETVSNLIDSERVPQLQYQYLQEVSQIINTILTSFRDKNFQNVCYLSKKLKKTSYLYEFSYMASICDAIHQNVCKQKYNGIEELIHFLECYVSAKIVSLHQKYLHRLSYCIDRISEAVDEENAVKIRHASHFLKNSVTVYGYNELIELSYSLHNEETDPRHIVEKLSNFIDKQITLFGSHNKR